MSDDDNPQPPPSAEYEHDVAHALAQRQVILTVVEKAMAGAGCTCQTMMASVEDGVGVIVDDKHVSVELLYHVEHESPTCPLGRRGAAPSN